MARYFKRAEKQPFHYPAITESRKSSSLKEIIIPLAVSLGICFLAGGIGSLFTTPAIDTWYATLQKPFFNPPNYVFGPIWTLLYVLMGISFYIIWSTDTKKVEKVKGVQFFLIQLTLNTLWSILFFGLKSPILALIGITVLWMMILLTILKFRKISKTAAWLIIPYLAWVSFAMILNLYIVLLN